MKMDYLKELLVELEQEESMDVDGGCPGLWFCSCPGPATNLSPGC